MDGQLSFLKHAISAPPEVFTFMHSPRKLVRYHTSVLRAVLPCPSHYSDQLYFRYILITCTAKSNS